MNNSASMQWSQADLRAPPEDEFSGFLDLDNIDFCLLNNIGAEGTLQGTQDVNTDMPDAPSFLGSDTAWDGSVIQHQQQQQMLAQPDLSATQFIYDAQGAYAIQNNLGFGAPPTQGYHPQGLVPPTPNSTEMCPETYRYMLQNDPQGRQRWAPYQLREDDAMALNTPLLSPDVAPSEASYQYLQDFSMSQYGLSPLTSPAIHPQNHNQRTPLVQSQTADSSLTASPIDLNFSFPQEMPSSLNERTRRTRRKLQPSRASSRGRPGSTISAGRRRGSFSVAIPNPEAIASIPESLPPSALPHSQVDSRRQSLSDHHDYSSSSKSISPRPLSTAVMAPPPKPISGEETQPVVLNQQAPLQSRPPVSGAPPATPMSLMRLQQMQGNGNLTSLSPISPLAVQMSPAVEPSLRSNLEDLHLPDALASTQMLDGQATPRHVMVTSGGRKILTPAVSATSSPFLGPTYSPSIAIKTARNSRKRTSAATALVSPALRPKISPSIKPLLPEGANLSSEAHALLLASKSNYQNIIEGTHLPGVSYPAELTSNLSSKRTSHKLAEQGRRNRINTALQELQTLLPVIVASPLTDKDEASQIRVDSPTSPAQDADQGPSGSRTPALTAQQSNSKAATVELAIDHIKLLKNQMAEKEAENEALKCEMRELREALESAIMGSATSSKSGRDRSSSPAPTKEGSMEVDSADDVAGKPVLDTSLAVSAAAETKSL